MGEGFVSLEQQVRLTHDSPHACAHAVAPSCVVGTAMGEGFVSVGQHVLGTHACTHAGTERGAHR
jgi:hypothetical protein